jgi:hypothetical protein
MSANGGDPLDFSCSLFFLFCVGNQAGTTRKFQTWFKTTHRLDGWMRPLKFWKFLERPEFLKRPEFLERLDGRLEMRPSAGQAIGAESEKRIARLL